MSGIFFPGVCFFLGPLLFLGQIVFISPRAWADLETSGYYENDNLVVAKRDGALVYGDFNKIRLRFDARPLPELAFHLEPRYYFFLIKTADLTPAGSAGLDKLILDRAYVKAYLPYFSLTAGKQRIAWGSGYIWNPTDIFNPYVLSFEVKEDEESNVEAVRLEAPLGQSGLFDGYITTNSPLPKAKKGLRAKTNIGLFDLSGSYVDPGDGGHQIGFDAAGEVWGFGVRGEAALITSHSSGRYIQAVLGWDYTLENGPGLNIEYFYSGQGQRNKEAYDWAGLYAGRIKMLAVDYLFLGLNKIIDELTEIRLSYLTNLDDGSFIFYPALTRSLAQDIDLSLEAMIIGGQEGSEYHPSIQQDPTGLAGSSSLMARLVFNF